MALQLQFFMVQAINYSVIIVKIKCKTHNIINRKRLPWCELINPYNLFFIVDMFYHTSRKTSRRDVKVSETLGSFKVSASVSNKILNVSVSETWVSGLVSVSAQKVSCTSLSTCILDHRYKPTRCKTAKIATWGYFKYILATTTNRPKVFKPTELKSNGI